MLLFIRIGFFTNYYTSLNREAEAKLKTLTNENSDLTSVVQQADNAISHLEKELIAAKKLAVDLTQQLSQSYEARKVGANNAVR